MRIELIHPPHFNCMDDRLDPPLGLLSIATATKRAFPDFEVAINDLSGVPSINKSWAGEGAKIGYADVYGITTYVCSLDIIKEIIAKCREINPAAKIVLGGAHVTARPKDDLGQDYVVQGYGEDKFIDYLSVAFCETKTESGSTETLDWSLVDVESYSRRIDGERSLPLITSRGCPFDCAFCGLHCMGRGSVVYRDVEDVLDEARAIKDAGVSCLNIQDDIFTLKKDRLRLICDGIKRLGMRFRCMGRAGYDDEDTYRLLANSGCVGVAWGIESGSQEILDRMEKQVTVKDNEDVVRWCKRHGMDSRAFFIIGFPGETEKTLIETRNFIMDADPDQYFISNFIPYPGTPVYADPKSFGITEMSYDYKEYYQVDIDGDGGCVISTEWLLDREMSFEATRLRFYLKEHKPMRGKNIQEYEK